MRLVMQYYAIPLVLSFGTLLYGIGMIWNRNNIVDRINLFPPNFDVLIGAIMILLAIFKIRSIFSPSRPPRYRKIAMIGMAVVWLVLTWVYFKNSSYNAGIMSAIITVACYVELWRGDYYS